MRRLQCTSIRILAILLLVSLPWVTAPAEEPSQSAVSAFNAYVTALEARLAQQHRAAHDFLVSGSTSSRMAGLQRGEVRVEQLVSPAALVLPGALLHHWRGTAFAPGVSAADFERLLRNVNGYPTYYAPQVLQAKALAQQGDYVQTWMRVRQHHVLTVVMDTTYDTTYGRLDAQHRYSSSRSASIAEIDSPGSLTERTLDAREQHGFLWRLNTYWSYEERDGGLYLQIESVSLTRSVPHGLGWVVGPFVETIPRESLEFTLRSTCKALQNLPNRELSSNREAGGIEKAQ